MLLIELREEGLVGTFFEGKRKDSAIIVLGGSGGGLSDQKARQLAAEGFSALALAYFAAESLPPSLSQIPLEYFERAIQWLKKKKGMKRVGIWGGSRGAEVALILGSLFPEEIDAMAVYVPSSVCYGSLMDPNLPAWTYQGRALLPNAPFLTDFSQDLGQSEEAPLALTPWFLKGMEEEKRFLASAIPVERLRCPLLLISAQDDQMWPSSLFSEQIMERLAAHNSPISATHLSYPKVGHAPGRGASGFHPLLRRWFAYGGSLEANALAARDWYEQAAAFFRRHLN